MTTIVPPGVTPTGETVVREIPGVGTVTFENYGPGEWMTKKGEPAKTSRRRYLLDGEELDSVSSIVGTLEKPALYHWHEDWGARGAVQAERMGELAGVPEEDYVKRIKSLGLGATAKKEEGADRGTVIHEGMQSLANGVVPNPADVPGIARPWLQGAMAVWLALRPKMICAEEIVCHAELGYAGRPDLIADVDGAVTLLDYKTGKGRVFREAHFQTRLYAMAKACEGLGIDRILIVGINDEGGFELVDCEASEEDALALLATYRACKRINAGMADQRRIARAAA